MEFRKFNKIPRLNREMIITEKIDGTNATISIERKILVNNPEKACAFHDGYYIFAGSRSRWLPSNLDGGVANDNYGFGAWVQRHAEELVEGLGEGMHRGEWWGQGIQRKYDMKEKVFSLFNTSMWNEENKPDCCRVVPVLYSAPYFNTNIIHGAVDLLRLNGSTAAPGYMNPEGIIVFHTAANSYFKVTCKNDDQPKGRVR